MRLIVNSLLAKYLKLCKLDLGHILSKNILVNVFFVLVLQCKCFIEIHVKIRENSREKFANIKFEDQKTQIVSNI